MKLLAKFTAGVALAALATPAFAQSSDSAAGGEEAQATETDDGSSLSAIVVTAQRRAGDLQQVPVAVTALDSESLDRRQIGNIEDVFSEVPGLIGSNNVGQSTAVTFFLRGVGNTESIVTVDPAVGVYVDDIYIARQGVNNFGFYDVERIEVLRGPQGTLYGRNSSAGAVKVVTKDPSFDFEANGTLGYGNYNHFLARGSFSGPIIDDKLAFRINLMTENHDGYSYNETLDKNVNDMNFFGARGALLFEPSETFSIQLTADYMEDNSNSVYPSNLASLPGEASSDSLFRIFSDTEQGNLGKTWGMGLTATWEIGSATLKSISGYRETQQVYNLDLSDSVTPIYELFTDNDSDQWSQEFNISGAAGDFEYTGGIYYFREDSTSYLGNEFNLRVPSGVADPPFVIIPTIYNEQYIQTDSTSYAIYGELTYNFTDRLSAFAGARYTWEKKDFATQFFVGGTPAGFDAEGQVLAFDNDDLIALNIPVELDFEEFTPRVGLRFEANDDLNLYASWSRGFKSGGWLARLVFPTPNQVSPFPPEIVDSYETGLKAELFGNSVRTNIAAFYTDFTDLFNTFTNVNGGFSGTTTDAEIYGIEFEGTWRIVSWLDAFANFAWMEGNYKGDIPAGLAAVLGDELQRLPTTQGKVGMSAYYPLDGDAGTIKANFDYSFIGKHYTAITNAPISETKYQIANASIGWERADERFGVTLSCRNCFDEEYFHSLLDFSGLGFAPAYPGEPRMYMVSLNVKY
ncbi:TonB-dependent receptor [Altererythrobacter sp. GH1-8]|uniref:TonB-dependent receptor n=1 Tax=Altererythrobacter sp. GH1-8 TaxID=3349333 RepID=UPI00374D0073